MTAHPSVEGPFLAWLVLAHLQAIGVAWALALASGRSLPRLRERLPAGGLACLGLAFAAFGLAALAETLDHTTTRWLYVNHTSPWNALFFSALAAGIALLSAALSASRRLRALLIALVLAGAAGYAAFGKGAAIASSTPCSLWDSPPCSAPCSTPAATRSGTCSSARLARSACWCSGPCCGGRSKSRERRSRFSRHTGRVAHPCPSRQDRDPGLLFRLGMAVQPRQRPSRHGSPGCAPRWPQA
jgi:hypothetical protein